MPTPAEDDETTRLALAAARGDRRALESFIRATQKDVWRLLAHLTEVGRADDLTQETYLRALGSIKRFEGRASARTWLLSIARRVVVDQVRTAVARPKIAHGVDWVAAADRQAPRHEGHTEIVELNLLLDDLAPERREALVLTQVLGLSYAEAAAVCGCPVGTVRSRVARAREDLVAATRFGGRRTAHG
ncbi:RNA polymerase sigma-70 factor (ECF subfamily) [Nocardia tenerifensis]|uniref:RNA polymerase sigma factor n=1 Tax=Nocardia tenerifensis TaxID=228006 RepID=A0A318K8S2_9NOCA|nr:RNA polymerase sigma factor SigC [Nocardia tenerifensis]PXX69114.1 RNA polymerase sigma-70 factor (ECF subfamily) [Nocardia tenerifensis]